MTENTMSNKRITRLLNKLQPKPKNKAQLVAILNKALESNILDLEALSMIKRILNVKDIRVKDIMVPRPQVVFIDQNDDFNHIIELIKTSGHSRFPVCGDSQNDIVGVLLAKDLLSFAFHDPKEFVLTCIIRQAMFIPEKKRLDNLLHEFRANKNHMAIVVDEYGGVTGIITIEDVLEQIVGDIEDEFDVDITSPMIKVHRENSFIVKAITDLTEFNAFFDCHFVSEDFESIGGLLLKKFGYLPKKNESIEIGGLTFTVLRADDRRIHLLQVTKNNVIQSA
jgi:magnesium and cobalt transporter